MKNCLNILFLLILSCSDNKHKVISSDLEETLQRLTQNLNAAEVNDDLDAFIQHYDIRALSMPEYQLTLENRNEIQLYYSEIFKRQNIKAYQRKAHEFVHLDKTIVEIGTFKKEYTDSENDSTVILTGQYWNVWTDKGGTFLLKGESYGYFHPLKHPESLIIPGNNQPDEADILLKKEIPFELKAYNALMEKGVHNRDAILRSGFFMEDGSFKPFADTTVTGMDKIKPYLIAYSSRGTVTINSVICYTLDFEYSDEYLLEYALFKVKWTNANSSGRTEGKGIRIWKRQADHSLRLYREIGTHNHLQ